ncbi:cyclic nucleotide-binding domain-containing protein [Aquisalimonas lutea]|uniref:Crp/Fnr family transcriptional regulator n=1 Tax=Aquisalimonas lutea TaxID=1327750 RepID=UPI0025B481D8|nr:cyclic nucleotide-binding domain-containing protein [Aquisalimonas lutea]MDN3519419.1 cyclic nucleotide-binding domain-containing protein [Aquisalimonas lutea]
MTDATVVNALSQESFFAGLDPAYIRFLGEHARERAYPRGEVLFREGERASTFYLVQGGEVLVEIPAIAGPSLELQRLQQGQILGWSWMIAPYRWTFMARAEADATVLEFDGEAILARCEDDPAFGYALLKRFTVLMTERLESARRTMMDEWNPPGFA